MIFDYVNNVGDNSPKPCLYDTFKHITGSAEVKELIERYRAGDAEAKKRLPAFLFHASFGGKKRLAKNATASGLVMVDFDHVSATDLDLYTAVAKSDQAKEWGLMLAHITPSGTGLRLVIRATREKPYEGCVSISDYQHRIASLFGAEDYLDEVTTDLSRLSFCPTADDIIYMTPDLFTAEKAVDFKGDETTNRPAKAEQKAVIFTSGGGQETFDGVPLTDIFHTYFELQGGAPTEGNRNAAFYAAARELRYICDFNPKVIARFMPQVGLTEKEVLDVCTSACTSSRAKDIPQIVRSIVQSLKFTEEEEEETTETEQAPVKLPPIFEHFTKCYPPHFRDAVVLAMLPCLGTLGTSVRARYLDGELHSPSFFTVVSAEQASGKSFARKIVNVLMEDLRFEDESARVVEQAYRNALRQSKNKKDQPEDPRVVIRIVPANVSVAKLLQRLDYAEGKHLFSFAEEMDTVIKANAGGSWSQKSDIYRNAFDNAEYGQDYMSDNSYSANLKIYYNMLVLGTPRQTNKFFSDVENGLVSRCMFASLPDGFGQKMPVFKEISPEGLVYVKKFVERLRECKDTLDLPEVNQALDGWLEEQRIQALQNADRARDIFRKRSAVIGFRSAMVLAAGLPKNHQRKKMLSDFAIYIASLVLEEQLKYAGARLEDALQGASTTDTKSRLGRRKELFNELPAEFTLTDVTTLMGKLDIKTPARQTLCTWRTNKLIEKIDKNKFRKV